MKALFGVHHQPYHQSVEHRQFVERLQPGVYKVVTVGEEVDTSWCPAGSTLVVRYHQLTENWGHRGEGDAFLPPSEFGVGKAEGERLGPAMTQEQARAFCRAYPVRRPVVLEQSLPKRYRKAALRAATPELLARAEQCGKEHARIYRRIADGIVRQGFPLSRVKFSYLNEPQLWSVEPPEATMAYMRGVLAEAHKLWIASVIGCFGVGWPGNGGVKDAPPLWAPFQALPSLMRPEDWFEMHAYWPMAGPDVDWKWLAGRYVQCPLAMPIFLGESGIDRGVEGISGHGWFDLAGTMAQKARTYSEQFKWFEAELRKDKRIVGHTPFTADGDGSDWASFEMLEENIMREQLDYAAWVRAQPEPVVPPVEPPVEPAGAFMVELRKVFPTALNLTTSLPTNPDISYATRGLGSIDKIVLHHTATSMTTTWDAVARYHVEHNGWPAIGYHLGVYPEGTVCYMRPLEEITYQVGDAAQPGDENASAVGICLPGDYRKDVPTAAMKSELAKLVQFLNGYLGQRLPVLGHREVSSGTVCPGANLTALLPLLNAGPPQVVIDDIRHAAWDRVGIPYTANHALATYARNHNLGAPMFDEFEVPPYVVQPFAGGIVYCFKGRYDEVMMVNW